MKKKPLFEVPNREPEKSIDGYTIKDFLYIDGEEMRTFYKNHYIEQLYERWIDNEAFEKVLMKYYDKIMELEKAQKLSKEEKEGIKKLAQFEADKYIETLPDIVKFKSYLDAFDIEYRVPIAPEVEYKDLETFPTFMG